MLRLPAFNLKKPLGFYLSNPQQLFHFSQLLPYSSKHSLALDSSLAAN
jgi:hypothetical protein